MNVWELSQFPFQMSSYLRAGEQRQSQRPLFHRCSFGKRREGGGTSAAIYGSAGIPPRDRAAHLYSPHVRLIPQEKLTGWWARRERGGGRQEGWREEVSSAIMWTKVIIVVIASELRNWFLRHNHRFFHSTHTCTWMSTRSYVEMFIHKCYWQGRYSKIKMATFPVRTHDIWRSVGTYVTPGCVVCQAGLCVCGCGCVCVSTILPLRPFPHSFQSN